MSPRDMDRKILWGASGNRCAFTDCRALLVHEEDEPNTMDKVVFGEEAHIVARVRGGPRGESDLPAEDRDRYENLVLLCRTHHRLIDKAPNDYPVERIVEMKEAHETWVNDTLDSVAIDPLDIRNAHLIYGWADRSIGSNWWAPLTSALFTARIQMSAEVLDGARRCQDWLSSRRLTDNLPGTQQEIKHFELALTALVRLLDQLLDPFSDWGLRFEPFYKEVSYPQADELFEEYDWLGRLVLDLGLELARSANAVSESIIEEFDPLFRDAEGLVSISSHDLVLGVETHRPVYGSADRRFESLSQFVDDRERRDIFFGTGWNKSAAARIGLT